MNKMYEFDAIIKKNPSTGGAYVEISLDGRAEFTKSRVPVSATFDGEAYDGQITKTTAASGYTIGVRKDIYARIGKQPGDSIRVTLTERERKPLEYSTVEEYIARYDGDVRARMESLRELILSCSPNISEKISWGMPTFTLNGNLVHFAAAKRHIGLYPGENGVASFLEKLEDYSHSKGAIQFPNDRPMPYDLIREIVMFRVRENTSGE